MLTGMPLEGVPVVHFWFDLVCPYAYLAHLRIEALCARRGVRLVHRPMLLGGVFRAIGSPDVPMDAMSDARRRMNALDLARWAARHGMPLVEPAGHPRRTVLALRAALASGEALPVATRALFAAYWAGGRDIADPGVVERALTGAGLDGAALVTAASSPAVKDRLRAATDAAVAAGVFGAPSFTVVTERGAQLFWGQDRLDFVERALDGWWVELPGDVPSGPTAVAR